MALLRLLGLAIKDIWRDFSRHRGHFVLASISLATGLFIAGGGLLAIDTLNRWVSQMEGMARITVFAAEGTNIGDIEQKLAGDPRFDSIQRISSEDATRQFMSAVRDAGLLLDTVGHDAIPDNLEVTLRPDLLERGKAAEVGEGLRAIEGIGDVILDHERIDSILKGVRAARGVLAAFGLTLLLVAAFSTGTVVRMSILARSEEINIMRLVGATEFFILAPLLVEGAILGLFGAILATGGLWLAWLPLSLGKFNVPLFITELARLAFFSYKNLAILSATGMITGTIGALWGFRSSAPAKAKEREKAARQTKAASAD